MEGRLGARSASPAGDKGGRKPSARELQHSASPRIQNGVPKRMRLVAPGGVVVSQVSWTGGQGKRTNARSLARCRRVQDFGALVRPCRFWSRRVR